MDKSVYIVSRIFLLGIAFTWWWLCNRVFRKLENNHPEKYSEIGRPTLRWGGNFKSNWSFVKFLFRSEYRPLNDRSLTRQCGVMKYLLATYCVLSISLTILVFAAMEIHQLDIQ